MALSQHWVAAGSAFYLSVTGSVSSAPCIRLVRSTMWPASRAAVESGLALLSRGDLHGAALAVGHEDAGSAGAFIHAWAEQEPGADKLVQASAPWSQGNENALSDVARVRARWRETHLVTVGFVVESCGARTSRDGVLRSILPLAWEGRRFEDGEEFGRALFKLPNDQRPEGLKKVTWENLTPARDTWMDADSATRVLESRGLRPSVLITVKDTPNPIHVDVAKYPGSRGLKTTKREGPMKFFLLAGRDGFLAKPKTGADSSDHSIVLKVSESFIRTQPETPQLLQRETLEHGTREANQCKAQPDQAKERNSETSPPKTRSLFPRPSPKVIAQTFPLSVAHKSLLRGTAFSSALQLCAAMEQLLDNRDEGTHKAIWMLFKTTFADISPYLKSSDKSVLGLDELLALSLISFSDPSFKLSPILRERVLRTACALQANQSGEALWAWRGFQKPKDKSLVLESTRGSKGEKQLRNVVKAALMSPLELATADLDMLQRYLTVLKEETMVEKLAPLPPIENLPDTVVRLESTEEKSLFAASSPKERETLRASVDTSVCHGLPLLMQARLPFAPANTVQHGIKAFARFENRLSSGLNVRAIVKQLNGGGGNSELFRMEQFLGKATKINTSKTDKDPTPEIRLKPTIEETLKVTPHEQELLNVLHSIQEEGLVVMGLMKVARSSTLGKADSVQVAPPALVELSSPKRPCAVKTRAARRRAQVSDSSKQPSEMAETKSHAASQGHPRQAARTAFLQLFGRKRELKVHVGKKESLVSVIIAGKPSQRHEEHLRVRHVVGGKTAGTRFLEPTDPFVRATLQQLIGTQEVLQVNFAPPHGFRWDFHTTDANPRPTVTLRIDEGTEKGSLCYWVNDTMLPAFDASRVLAPCRIPTQVLQVDKELGDHVEEAFYTSKAIGNDLDLMPRLDSMAIRRLGVVSQDAVYDWKDIAARSGVTNHVFRDVLLKLTMRDSDTIAFSASSKANAAVWQTDFSSEGTGLRVVLALSALYPHCLQRITDDGLNLHAFRFQIDSVNAQYCELVEFLSQLAYGEGSADKSLPSSRGLLQITTKLWKHQQNTVDKVLEGIRNGLFGFADASAVGSGKTLTALAAIQSVQEHRKARHKLFGSLVLLPTKTLVQEWTEQIMLHTKGCHVLTQNAQGFLQSAGVSSGNGEPAHKLPRGSAVNIGPSSIVLTTLARAREHPFKTAGWDVVVVDECLSVQNEALQSSAAWRQVAASGCVLLLSATFFRSKLSKLYYMLRMLRSPLPRTEPYLPTLLSEHAVVHLSANPRSWQVNYRSVHMDDETKRRYVSTFEQAYHGGGKDIYSALKGFLRDNYEKTFAVQAMAEEVERLREAGRRPLVFATSISERDLLLELIPKSESLSPDGDKNKTLIVTVHEGSHGLNLQDRADAIVTRPQPGDLIEQMKGRIDRPNQKLRNLKLVVVVAHDTLEEAEASNIRLCGTYFRQYLDPLGKPFQERAIAAYLASSHDDPDQASMPGTRQLFADAYRGAVADTFRSGLGEVEHEADEVSWMPTQETRDDSARPCEVKVKTETLLEDSSSLCEPLTSIPESIETSLLSTKVQRTQKKRKAKSIEEQSPAIPLLVKKKKARVKKPPKSSFVSDGPPRVLSAGLLEEALQHFSKDARLAAVVSQVGAPTSLLGKVGDVDPFLSLVKSIVYQQISVKAGAAIFGRVQTHLGGADQVTPERILSQSDEDLKGCGLSARKAEYAKCLATFWIESNMTRERLENMTDHEILEALLKVKGIGEWTIHMFLMFSLGRPDILPSGDLVVRKAFKRLYGSSQALVEAEQAQDTKVVELPGPAEVLAHAEPCRPYRSVLTWLLWHAVESDSAAYTY